MRFYTIAEYAEIHGISPQAVYKKINKGHLETVKKKDTTGKQIKYVVVYEGEEQKETIQPEIQPVSQPAPPEAERVLKPLNQPLNQPEIQPNNQQFIDLLVSQISEKDKQIERLQAQIAEQQQESREKDRVIQEQVVKLNELLERSQELQAQGNLLLRGKQPEEVIEVYHEKPVEPKQSFWKRLFKRG